MKRGVLIILFFVSGLIHSQIIVDSIHDNDSSHVVHQLILQQQARAKMDSIIKYEIQQELAKSNTSDKEKAELEIKLRKIQIKDSISRITQLKKIEDLKKSAVGYPVILFDDTLLKVYTKIGSFNAKSRAEAISLRIKKLYEDDFLNIDSIFVQKSETGADIIYKNDQIILSVGELDALWMNLTAYDLAKAYEMKVKLTLQKYKDQNSFSNLLKRIGQIALIVFSLGLIIYFILKLFKRIDGYILKNQEKYLNGLTIKKFRVFTPEKHRQFVKRAVTIIRWGTIVLMIYLSLPLIFSVFPETKSFTNTLISWILSPAKRIFSGIIGFLPNLFTILVIYYVTRWAIKGINYFFTEIELGNITISGFHKDWAIPTFNILKFILYAFMVVVIFPYLPGSDSAAFQGVSVFLGVLFSLGSSSAITNIIAGLVITYMRPFKTGDRVKIGEVVGDVVEKTMLVTRIKTIKNEDITVPNSTVLSSHTINYSSNAEDIGLIIHTTVTIGYDVPWKKMHEALLKAADRTDLVLKEPKAFVLQTSLDDFYVSYQLNAYTKEANKQAIIYSHLHQNIQDCCNEADIEILSPHYRAMRDGSHITIPSDYLSKDYVAPDFNIKIKKEN